MYLPSPYFRKLSQRTLTTLISSDTLTAGIMTAIAPAHPGAATTTAYTYGQTGYTNPDAVTTIGNGTATTTYTYDTNGNLTSLSTGATTTTYTYDYANHLISLGVNGATTTYAYDPTGTRISQTLASTTTLYPSKYFSILSTLTGTTTTATSTEYIYTGDTLLATIDQYQVNGTPVGTATTTYIHPDNLGSTHFTSDKNGNLVQFFDYAPYGSVLTTTNVGGGNTTRQFEGLFADTSGLVYSNARYLNPGQGQFTSQDPVFWTVNQNLANPQSLNAYSYALDNPINRSDPSGNASIAATLKAIISGLQSLLASLMGGGSSYNSTGIQIQNNLSSGVKSGNASSISIPGKFVSQGNDSNGCLKACNEMSGYTPSGSVNISQYDSNGNLTTSSDAQKGIRIIDQYLANGSRVTVGVNRGDGTNPNNNASQHYVTITGSGYDTNGKYYTFNDPGTQIEKYGSSPSNKLYVNQNSGLSGESAYTMPNGNHPDYVVTEVKTK